MPALIFRCLGPLEIRLGDAPLDGFETRKARALLVYLACHAGQDFSREHLQALLWGERLGERAARSLRQALVNLRRILPPDCLLITRETVAFNPNCAYELDIKQFESDSPETALALYRGALLQGFDLPDAPFWEEWLSIKREELQVRVLSALATAGARYAAHGDYGQAVSSYRCALAIDPWSEMTYQYLMRLYALRGEHAAALAQYEKCRQALAEGLGVSPALETQALAQRIRDAATIRRPALPRQPTPFVGREAELALIAERLAEPHCRLLSLVGPGGAGKTRLALQAAERSAGFLHGAFFVPLTETSGAAQPGLIATAIADVLGLALHQRAEPQAQVLEYLRDKELLLILDNFEHLVNGATWLVELLETAPQVKLLVTSRERLNLQWEWLGDVGGLALPPDDTFTDPEHYSAVQLFLQTARRFQPGFELTTAEMPFLIRICQHLGGMPLGIELAAALTRSYSCREVAAAIERDPDILTTSLRDLPERHRSLRAVFDSSWTLLSPAEQTALAQLSLFRGSFTVAAAAYTTVAFGSVFTALADKSLLRSLGAGRYELHELVRQYAAERLAADAQLVELAQLRYCDYYAGFLNERLSRIKGAEQKAALDEIAAELENVRALWSEAARLRVGRAECIERALESYCLFCALRAHFAEGVDLFSCALKAPGDLPRAVAGKLLARQGYLRYFLTQLNAAQTQITEALAIARDSNDPGELAFCCLALASVTLERGDFNRTRQLWNDAIELYRQVGDDWGTTAGLNSMGLLESLQGNYAAARQFFETSLALGRRGNLHANIADAWWGLGLVTEAAGELKLATHYYEAALRLKREIGDVDGIGLCLNQLGFSAGLQGRFLEAREYLQEALALYREHGVREGVAWSLDYLGVVAAALGDFVEARQLFEESLRLRRELGNLFGVALSLSWLGQVVSFVGEVEAATQLFSEGLKIAAAIEAKPVILDILCNIADNLWQVGDAEQAAGLLTLCLQHPALHFQTRTRAQTLLHQIETDKPAAWVATAISKFEFTDLEEAAAAFSN